jgi:hypothetical protein
MEHISPLCGVQVMSWNELELHDHVQVKDEDMPIYSHAVIIGLHTNGTYDVQYDVSGPYDD